MRQAFSASKPSPSGRDKGRRKGAAEQLLTDQALSLRARLHGALALGLTKSDGHGAKKWQSTDAGIQSHVLKAVAAFVGSLSNEALRLAPVKESISDILLALEGILKTHNVSVLIQAADVSLRLVSSIGNSVRQYPILEMVSSLSCQLSADQLRIAVPCASALTCILNSLVTARTSTQAEIWEALEKTNAVASVISALQNYTHDVHPLNYLTEMISLLRSILWIWPSSRYHVWSNCNLMAKLAQYCLSAETTVAAKILKLYAALALCGNGVMVLLKDEELIPKICDLMGKSHPSVTRIEALKLCQVLLRSPRGCNQLITSHYHPIVQGIINAMSEIDEKSLVTEGCRTALLALRYHGNHHRCFWSNSIDEVLYKILAGSCSSEHQTHQMLCHGTSSLATDITQRNSSTKFSKEELEPALRAILMMLLSPSQYIFSEASSKFLEVVLPLGDECMNILLSSLESNVIRNLTASFDCVKIMNNLMNLACLVIVQSNHSLNKRSVVGVLSTIIKECLHNRLYITRSNNASHLQFCFDGGSCCYLAEEWEGENVILFYGLVVLYNVLRRVSLVCIHCEKNLDGGIVCHDCREYYNEGLIRVLEHALGQNLSPGPKSYIAHILSLFGLCGFPSKLGAKMRSALCDNELVDLELLLADSEPLSAHAAILSVRCSKLLPSGKSLVHDGKITYEGSRRSLYHVRMSDRVDSHALKKILEYAYAGFVTVDADTVKPVKTLAKFCHLKSLQEMLQREQPRWSSDCPRYDLTAAVEPAEHSFSDIILEAQSNEKMECHHGSCELSTPHVHSHKIVLSMTCDYLRALFQSGMHESFAEAIRVPVRWGALDKLVQWFYKGELPRIAPDCRWKNMNAEEQLSHLKPYVELSSLAEFWFLEGVKEESLEVVAACLNSSTNASLEFIGFAANLGQWDLVEAAIGSVAHLYPRLRDSGQLEQLDEDVLNMLRAEYVRYSQHRGGSY
ncbi:BTB/POZ domain-containing protein At1g04390 isoform X2 [Panicum hallii]|uniref:BTB/POZ domain-containing protein At1g04390 isoform X2 n=1 Tax=Panicum hallii TaxID=206008 RepID=UPI000DF4CBAF|nr:BTB/POZ domain-containing protein At1g04390 isoform X2 [Panicum hallii]